jgi:hypothetical protein
MTSAIIAMYSFAQAAVLGSGDVTESSENVPKVFWNRSILPTKTLRYAHACPRLLRVGQRLRGVSKQASISYTRISSSSLGSTGLPLASTAVPMTLPLKTGFSSGKR